MLCWVTISSRTFYPLPIHRSSWESHRHLQFIRTKARDTHSASLPLVSSPIFPHLPIILLSWLKEETSQSTCLPLAHPKWDPKVSFVNFANFAFEIYFQSLPLLHLHCFGPHPGIACLLSGILQQPPPSASGSGVKRPCWTSIPHLWDEDMSIMWRVGK